MRQRRLVELLTSPALNVSSNVSKQVGGSHHLNILRTLNEARNVRKRVPSPANTSALQNRSDSKSDTGAYINQIFIYQPDFHKLTRFSCINQIFMYPPFFHKSTSFEMNIF